ncbi:MAG: hypothetical protein KDC46_06350, partial [Thermoleophilia bacterium]|nr:hypothetical protein [Thermoleophilia bacterium]
MLASILPILAQLTQMITALVQALAGGQLLGAQVSAGGDSAAADAQAGADAIAGGGGNEYPAYEVPVTGSDVAAENGGSEDVTGGGAPGKGKETY